MSVPTRLDDDPANRNVSAEIASATKLDSPQSAARTRLDSAASLTRTDDSNSVPTTLDDQRSPLVGVRIVVPSALRQRFNIERQLPTAGAEADILLAEELSPKRKVILKIYRQGIQPKSEVLEKIASSSPNHVVQLYSYGNEDGVFYEVMEYAQHGSLRDLIQQGAISPKDLTEVLSELTDALEHLHSHKIIHRDLKPENILVRTRTPNLDLVLTDFGIASVSEFSQRFTNNSRTLLYGSPESAAGVIGVQADWWSLGMIMLEIITGRHPYQGLSDSVVMREIAVKSVDVSGIAAPRWRQLCKGLLVRDPQNRWCSQQVRKWLSGEDVLVIEDSIDNANHRPYTFDNKTYYTPKLLANGLASNWENALRDRGRGLITDWLRSEIRDQEITNRVIDIDDDRSLTPDQKLLHIISLFDPEIRPTWKGYDASLNGIISLAQEAKTDANKQELLEDLIKNLKHFDHVSQKQIARELDQAIERYNKKWSELSGDVSKRTQPSKHIGLANIVLVTLDTNARSILRKKLIEPEAKKALLCPWYANLGNPETQSPAEQLVALAIIKLANEWVDEAERKAREAEINRQQRLDTAQTLLGEIKASPIPLEFLSMAERLSLTSTLQQVIDGDESIDVGLISSRWNVFKSSEASRKQRAALTVVLIFAIFLFSVWSYKSELILWSFGWTEGWSGWVDSHAKLSTKGGFSNKSEFKIKYYVLNDPVKKNGRMKLVSRIVFDKPVHQNDLAVHGFYSWRGETFKVIKAINYFTEIDCKNKNAKHTAVSILSTLTGDGVGYINDPLYWFHDVGETFSVETSLESSDLFYEFGCNKTIDAGLSRMKVLNKNLNKCAAEKNSFCFIDE